MLLTEKRAELAYVSLNQPTHIMRHITSILTLAAVLLGSTSLHAKLQPALRDAVQNPDGSYTNWFGTYTPFDGTLSNEDWIDHEEHGSIYITARGNGLWIYDPNVKALGGSYRGWIYTSRNHFPYFIVNARPTQFLLYVQGVEGPAGKPRVFVDMRRFNNVYLPKATTDTIVEVAVANPNFSSLVTAVSTAGLVDALSGEGPFTVFAPTDDAFAALDSATLTDLLNNPESLGALQGILTYHVVPGRITAEDLGLDVAALFKGEAISGYLQTLNGADLRFDITPFGVLINGDTMVTTPDIEASNGIIHVIDKVLLPPQDIVDTAIAAGFNTLVAAVQAAGLEGALRGPGPLTVFAPTEDAFAALGADTINALLADPDTLANILLYHVTSGQAYSTEVAAGPLTMLNTASAEISITPEGGLKINDANIVITDIVAANGVIHVIDAVILPPSE